MDEIELTMSNDNIKAKANVSGDEVGGEEGSAPPSKKREHGMMASESEDLELNAAETTVQGQMKINPGFTIEQAKAAAKKEYNRRNSARSRVRSKKMVNQLQEECARLTKREEELVRENLMLRNQVEFYKRKAGESSAPDLKPSSFQDTSQALRNTLRLQELLHSRSLPVRPSLQHPLQLQSTLLGQMGSGSLSLAAPRFGAMNLMPTAAGGINNPSSSVARVPGLQAQTQQQQYQHQHWDNLSQPRVSLSSPSSIAQLSPRTRALVAAMLEEQDKQSKNQN